MCCATLPHDQARRTTALRAYLPATDCCADGRRRYHFILNKQVYKNIYYKYYVFIILGSTRTSKSQQVQRLNGKIMCMFFFLQPLAPRAPDEPRDNKCRFRNSSATTWTIFFTLVYTIFITNKIAAIHYYYSCITLLRRNKRIAESKYVWPEGGYDLTRRCVTRPTGEKNSNYLTRDC